MEVSAFKVVKILLRAEEAGRTNRAAHVVASVAASRGLAGQKEMSIHGR
jgi:hypothetical protein